MVLVRKINIVMRITTYPISLYGKTRIEAEKIILDHKIL